MKKLSNYSSSYMHNLSSHTIRDERVENQSLHTFRNQPHHHQPHHQISYFVHIIPYLIYMISLLAYSSLVGCQDVHTPTSSSMTDMQTDLLSDQMLSPTSDMYDQSTNLPTMDMYERDMQQPTGPIRTQRSGVCPDPQWTWVNQTEIDWRMNEGLWKDARLYSPADHWQLPGLPFGIPAM